MITCKASAKVLVEPENGSFPAVYKTVFLCWSDVPSVSGRHWFIIDDTDNCIKFWLFDVVAEDMMKSEEE